MRHFLFSFVFVVVFCNSKAQTNKKIIIGNIDSIQSTILKEKRRILVHVPGDGDIHTKQRYPVIYLLDGDDHFSSVVGILQFLSRNMVCPEMIVVGISNTDRMRDLTPTHLDNVAGFKTSGGVENFISFIEKELIPYIDSQYPTEPYKMMIGHSLGGLTAIQILLHHTNLFNSYICIDPSMSWDNQTLLKESRKVLANKQFQGVSVFLGIANTMGNDMNIDKVLSDTSSNTKHIRSILELKGIFDNSKLNGLNFQSKYYNDDSHGTVPLIAEYDALHFLFDFYPMSMKDYTDTTDASIAKFEKHFLNISKQMGYKVKPSENEMNDRGYQALRSKQYKKAERFFKDNIDNYPESYNVYDSMGDYYDAIDDKSNAIKYYEKALSIKEDDETRLKLKKLTTK